MSSSPIISQYVRRAMATEFVVMLPGDVDGKAEHAFAALEIAEQLENLLSIYRPNSEISRLNGAAGGEPVPVSPDTFQILTLAQELARQTEGAFDISAGPLVEAWGFTRRQGAKPSDDQLDAARQLVGYQHLRLDPVQQTAELTKAGMSVNLGAIGKGFTLDRMAAELKQRGVTHFLIHGGQSSVLAAGDDVPGSDDGWRVAIEHPVLPGVRLGGIRMRDQALGTSGSGKQFFHFKGKRYGHVIDPRSGVPASNRLLSLTVLSRSAAVADALATGLFVCGSEAAILWAKDWNARNLGRPENSGLENSSVLGDWMLSPLGVVTIDGTDRQAQIDLSIAGIEPEDWIAADEP